MTAVELQNGIMSTKKKSSATTTAAATTATTATPKATGSSTKKSARRGRVPCGVCQSPIVDGKDEALLCEGECGYWLHRGCASVPPSLYKELSTSPDPFTCLSCSNIQLKREIQLLRAELSNMTTVRDKLAALETEVATLREMMSSSCQPPPSVPHSKRSYARAARTRTATRPATSPTRTAVLSKSSATQQQQRVADSPQSIPSRKERVPVEGVRRVWGTMKATTTTAVASTLQKLTCVGSQLLVRKKTNFETNRWWFLLKGPEPTLCKLADEWDKVSLQTNWKLEPCTKPAVSQSSSDTSASISVSPTLPNLKEVTTSTNPAPEDGQDQTQPMEDANDQDQIQSSEYPMAQPPHQAT